MQLDSSDVIFAGKVTEGTAVAQDALFFYHAMVWKAQVFNLGHWLVRLLGGVGTWRRWSLVGGG